MANKLEDDPSTAGLDLDNDNYVSAEDSDFQLDEEEAEIAGDDSSFSSEEEGDGAEGGRPAKKRKLDPSHRQRPRKRKAHDEGDMELDSGDEATILKAKNKKKRKATAGDGDQDEDIDVLLSDTEEGGGFVKTRSMRMKMEEERKPLARTDGATIDVDELWAKMNAPGTDSGLLQSQKRSVTEEPDHEQQSVEHDKENIIQGEATTQGRLPSEDMIKIKRTYKFAGEIHTEEKMVPRDSAEAKLYLAETAAEKPEDLAEGLHSEANIVKLRRPLRKVSRFDPNPTGVIKKSWEKQQVRAVSGDADELKGPKLNTVEKSRLDWAQYVDETGIKDELNVHSKAKEGYMGRMDFLNRVDAKREEERRNIRLKGL
ncbi:SWR1-complex protein 5 [Talaromyces atroroseus]|uniref:SWR1-complex protein 5 n=1 Tax=Talaromyces atroroseus TaxID=1441469 RepID=A0A225ARQ7_TALAT|nr:SWR1-complex protein 5 [Talaromyces atroroseus]OKL56127.1 SWR1-complex protein 5 [Talaromyces atroroseus]